MPTERKTAVISSTVLDLPDHRRQVAEACQRMGVFPKMMENLPARDAEAIKVSIQLVDDADIYIGVFAHRYGHVPRTHKKSITEMEYDRACERGIPCLIFFMHEDHSLLRRDVQCKHQNRLRALKARIFQVRAEFQSAFDLRGHVIEGLATLREEDSP